MSTTVFTSRPRVFPTRRLLTFLFLLAAAAFATMPAVGQAELPYSAEPVLSGQALGGLQPGGSLHLNSSRTVSDEAREIEAFGLRTYSPDFSGVRLTTNERVPGLGPVRLGRPLQQGVRGARILQRNGRLHSEPASVPPHRRRWDAFKDEVISLKPVSAGLLTGTIGHLADSPSAWDRDVGGYLGRVGTSMGSQVVGIGVRHGVSAALDLRLESPEPQGPLLARLGQVALQEITVRTASGQRVPAVAKTASFYASNLARSQVYYGRWKPGEAATGTAIAIGNGIAISLIGELIGAL